MTPDSMLESTQPELQTTPYSFNANNQPPISDAPMPVDQTMSTDMGTQYAEWVAEGGSGDWESFRQSLIQRGRPDPGAYSPNKIPGIELEEPENQATSVSTPPKVEVTPQRPAIIEKSTPV